METFDERTYLTIDRSALRHNISAAVGKVGKDVKIMCLVKANAYGHGAVGVAKCCADCVDYFGVATIDEGIELRKNNVTNKILVVGDVPPCKFIDALDFNIETTVHSLQSASELNCLCNKINKRADVHIAIDSGMGRIGFLSDEISQAKEVFAMKNLQIRGVFSHFSKADEKDKTYSLMQKKLFDSFTQKLSADGCDLGLKHIANSAAVLDMHDCNYDMIRMGIMTYGLYPSIDVDKELELVPAMSWYARIAHIKTLREGRAVSYGGDFVTNKTTTVATLSVGYGDGYPRALSNKGYVLIRGKKAPVIGRICMDQTMVDVSGIDAKVGDNAVLLGKQGDEIISAEDIANWANTINYEVVCGISHRVPRRYI